MDLKRSLPDGDVQVKGSRPISIALVDRPMGPVPRAGGTIHSHAGDRGTRHDAFASPRRAGPSPLGDRRRHGPSSASRSRYEALAPGVVMSSTARASLHTQQMLPDTPRRRRWRNLEAGISTAGNITSYVADLYIRFGRLSHVASRVGLGGPWPGFQAPDVGGAPAKKAKAATWTATQERASRRSTGRTTCAENRPAPSRRPTPGAPARWPGLARSRGGRSRSGPLI